MCAIGAKCQCPRGVPRWHALNRALRATLIFGCTLLIGDLAALHDLSALMTVKKAGALLTIVILNNAGGGIFRFLPIASHEQIYSPYFDTPHDHDFGQCCEAFGIPYVHAATRTSRAIVCAREMRAHTSPTGTATTARPTLTPTHATTAGSDAFASK